MLKRHISTNCNYYCQNANRMIYFRSDTNMKSKEYKVYNINLLKNILGDDVCSQLLFLHAFTGCDSTSRIFNIGKKPVFRKLIRVDKVIKSCASTFIVEKNSQEDISTIGETKMVHLFGGKSTDTLSSFVFFRKRGPF